MVEFEPLINGREYGWGDIAFAIGGVPVVGITAIDYDDGQEKENVRGAGRKVVGRAYGRENATASITLLGSTVFALQKQAPQGKLHKIKPFDIVVSYQPDDAPLVIHHIKDAEFLKTQFSWSEGDMSKSFKFDLIISDIKDKS